PAPLDRKVSVLRVPLGPTPTNVIVSFGAKPVPKTKTVPLGAIRPGDAVIDAAATLVVPSWKSVRTRAARASTRQRLRRTMHLLQCVAAESLPSESDQVDGKIA